MNAPVAYSDQALDILECMSDAFYSVDADWRILYANRRTEWIWGVQRVDILSRSLWDVTADFRFARSAQELRRAMLDRTPVTFETYSLYLENHIEVDAYPARHGGLDVYFRNITGRKQAEKFNQEAECMLQLATDATGIGFWQWDTFTDEMSTLNTSSSMPQEWHHKTIEESIRSIHPDDRDMVQRLLGESKYNKKQYKCRLRRVMPNGDIVWVDSQGQVVLDQNGDVRQLIGVNYGVSEERSAEAGEGQKQALPVQLREHDLHELLQSGCDGYWVIDDINGTKECSAQWKRLCGTEDRSPTVEYQRDGEWIHPEDRPRATARLQNALLTKQTLFEDEYRVNTTQGERWYLFRTRIKYTQEGRPHLRYTTAFNIHEHKSCQAMLLQKNNQLTNFGQKIIFNQKTLLTTVLLAIDMLDIHAKHAAKNNTKNLGHYVGLLRQNVYRLMRLMSNLIDITMLNVRPASACFQEMDLVQELQDLVHTVNYHLLGQDVAVMLQNTLDRLTIKIDRDKLQRILLNLLSNALHHTQRPGSITLTLCSSEQFAYILVANEGEHIPENKLSQIFDFCSDTISSPHNRNGMGLYLCKCFVEQMQGRIWAESPAGRGACFHIELPLNLEAQTSGNIVIDSQSLLSKVEMEFSDMFI